MGDVLRTQGDPYYGRLFTANDVHLLMAVAARTAWIQAKELVDSLGATDNGPAGFGDAVALAAEQIADTAANGHLAFPADEPMFLLRGSDKAAVSGVGGYAVGCEEQDAPREHLLATITAASAMVDWQRENPDRVQVPPVPLRQESA